MGGPGAFLIRACLAVPLSALFGGFVFSVGGLTAFLLLGLPVAIGLGLWAGLSEAFE